MWAWCCRCRWHWITFSFFHQCDLACYDTFVDSEKNHRVETVDSVLWMKMSECMGRIISKCQLERQATSVSPHRGHIEKVRKGGTLSSSRLFYFHSAEGREKASSMAMALGKHFLFFNQCDLACYDTFVDSEKNDRLETVNGVLQMKMAESMGRILSECQLERQVTSVLPHRKPIGKVRKGGTLSSPRLFIFTQLKEEKRRRRCRWHWENIFCFSINVTQRVMTLLWIRKKKIDWKQLTVYYR